LGRFEFKVPGGKLIVAETRVERGRLARVKITGDFFMHPEESIEELEGALAGLPAERGSLEKAVKVFFGIRSVDLIGVSPGDFIHVLEMSLGATKP